MQTDVFTVEITSAKLYLFLNKKVVARRDVCQRVPVKRFLLLAVKEIINIFFFSPQQKTRLFHTIYKTRFQMRNETTLITLD